MSYWPPTDVPLSNRRTWTRCDTSHSDSYYAFKAVRNQAHTGFRYAPITDGSLYVKVPSQISMLKLIGREEKKDIYVSLLLLLYMGSEDFYDNSEEAFNDQNILNYNINPNNEHFIAELEAKSPPSRLLDFGNHEISFPVRTSSGKAESACLKHKFALEEWDKLRGKLIAEHHAVKGKPPRYVRLLLNHSLKVQLQETRMSLLLERISSNKEAINEWFSDLVGQVNEANVGNVRALEVTQNQPAGYIEIAKDPFEIYSTWIHQEDWNKYMDTLGLHHFPSEDNDILKGIWGKLADQANVLLSNKSVDELAETFNLETEDTQAILKARGDIIIRGREMSQENQARVYAGMQAMFRQACAYGPGNLTGFLDARKMRAVVGKRKEERGQAAVMANCSATEVAHGFGWPTNKLATGFSVAEWLHLSAYSWGGLEESGEYLSSSSQTPENLVFGTSETNSLMTRYEVAWQKLLLEEQDMVECLRAYRSNNGVVKDAEATLQISINDPRTPVCYDKLSDGNYKRPFFFFDGNEIEYIRNNLLATFADLPAGSVDDPLSISQLPNTVPTTQRRMLKLAQYYPSVAYSITYAVQLETPSKILSSPGVTQALYFFYPFQRPFFHTAESQLDDLIWADLVRLGWNDVCDCIQSNYPHVTIESEAGEDVNYREQVWSKKIQENMKKGISPVPTERQLSKKKGDIVDINWRDIKDQTSKGEQRSKVKKLLNQKRGIEK
ncbi:hypothetical protein FBEOM_8673 [Fusarium beomiforme]|uniref:Uncharacterized protein n=1 Tax=Fusarium beomiforme TaxID=44412 RepID=A0A9P5AFI5_9HYPO|nr:hypothetical protein FBEOM_8673 [Fusarium beomiforme]